MSPYFATKPALLFSLIAMQLACTGEMDVMTTSAPQQIDGLPSSDDPPIVIKPAERPEPVIKEEETSDMVGSPVDPCAGDLDPGISPMRALSRQEFDYIVGELFEGIDSGASRLPPDERIGSFALNGSDKVTTQYVDALREIAEDLAVTLREEESSWLGCSTGEQSTCTREAMRTLLPRMYRRDLKQGELDGVMALYALGATESGHLEGVRLMMEALLQSPSFIYTYTMGAGHAGETVDLDDLQIAHRMAALLWRSIPDDALLLAAARGELSDPEARRQQAERMLDDPRARAALNDMVLQWFEVDSLSALSLGQIDQVELLRRAMQRESERLIDHVLWTKQADYRELLTAPYTFLDETMIEHYGVEPALLTEEVEPDIFRVELEGRRGILSHASVLAHGADVIHRGKRIRHNILCDDIPGPGDIDTLSIPTGPTESERSKATKRMESTSCNGCHLRMDNIGLVFDLFDELGAPREQDRHGNLVSADGELRYTLDIDGVVAGVDELTTRLADSKDVQECVAENLFTYSFARRADRDVDACTMHVIERSLEAHDGDVRQALLAIIDTHTFTTARTQ